MNTIANENWPELTKPVYGLTELSEILGVHRSKVWRIQRSGYLRKLPVGRGNRVPRTELIRYLEAASIES